MMRTHLHQSQPAPGARSSHAKCKHRHSSVDFHDVSQPVLYGPRRLYGCRSAWAHSMLRDHFTAISDRRCKNDFVRRQS